MAMLLVVLVIDAVADIEVAGAGAERSGLEGVVPVNRATAVVAALPRNFLLDETTELNETDLAVSSSVVFCSASPPLPLLLVSTLVERDLPSFL